MPNINSTVTYNATANGSPTAPVTWSGWIVNGGTEGTHYTKTGGGTTSSITITWLIAGTYTVSATGDNCGPAVTGTSSNVVVLDPCIPYCITNSGAFGPVGVTYINCSGVLMNTEVLVPGSQGTFNSTSGIPSLTGNTGGITIQNNTVC